MTESTAPLVALHHGTPLMMDYTPASAVVSGDVIVLGNGIVIAHSDIAAGEVGSVACGGGVYKFPKSAGSAITGRKAVYWDASGEVATETADSNKLIGVSTPDGAASAATSIYVQHELMVGTLGGGSA